MEALILAVNAVLPILLLMAVGYITRKGLKLDDPLIRKMNSVVFHVMLPTLIFVNLYENNFMDFLDIRLIICITLTTLGVLAASSIIFPRFCKKKTHCSVMIQGVTRGNVVYIGMPVMTTLVGSKYLGLMSLAIVVIIILYNVSSVVIFEVLRDDDGIINMKNDSDKLSPVASNHSALLVNILKGIITNPLIIGAVIGVIFTILNWRLPVPIFEAAKSLGSAATPTALLLLGASIHLSDIKPTTPYKKTVLIEIIVTVLTKLIIFPAIAIFISLEAGLAHYELVVMFCILAAPTAVATFTVAQSMGGNSKLAAQIVAWSSATSMITIFCWILILQNILL